jgi:predicted metal-binding membrane protein
MNAARPGSARTGPTRPVAFASIVPRMDAATGWTVAIVVLAMLAWIAALIVMADHDEGPGTPLHDFPTFLAGWIVMLTAMMLPSEISYVRAFAALSAERSASRSEGRARVLTFVAGYGLAWVAYGAVAYAADAAIRAAALDVISWLRAGPLIAGSVLVLAGLYQISRLKEACLSHCRSPLSYFARRWRPGRLGSLRMGLVHGLVCVGCCWALMAVMFAVGAMSLIWMGLLGLLMFAEKVLPAGPRLALPIAVFLSVMGMWIAVSPDTAPLMKDPLLYGSAICRAR